MDSSLPDTLPQIQRLRHELRWRNLTLAATERLTPSMIRLTFTGADLQGFVSAGADDHIKITVPGADGTETRRDYTPRRYDAARGELVLDVVDHAGGLAADWARAARVGDGLTIGGPRGSAVIGGDIAQWLLIGDETALPAIGRRIEELPAGVPVTSLVAVPSVADEQVLTTAARHEALWLHRPLAEAARPEPFLAALDGLEIPERTFVWVAAEAGVARALRAALIARGVPKAWIKASGYWVEGQADASVKAMED
ncbi:siderophore-interacting protein [Paenirhodobacter sp.]|uniref:siderophore-interacting protein n=1 Tax=Paenirhodobacter sp. TaxID=1965326 RepID=UPI003B511BE7